MSGIASVGIKYWRGFYLGLGAGHRYPRFRLKVDYES